MGQPAPARQPPPDPELSWVTSSFSFANGNCVQVAQLPDGGIGIRDSKDPAAVMLRFTPAEWHAFLHGARNREFDHFG
jgi:hypothetical protein